MSSREAIDHSSFRQLRAEAVVGQYRSKTSGQWFDSVIHEARLTAFQWRLLDAEKTEREIETISQEIAAGDDGPVTLARQRLLTATMAVRDCHKKFMSKYVAVGKGIAADSLSRKCRDKKASAKIAALRAVRTMYLTKRKSNG